MKIHIIHPGIMLSAKFKPSFIRDIIREYIHPHPKLVLYLYQSFGFLVRIPDLVTLFQFLLIQIMLRYSLQKNTSLFVSRTRFFREYHLSIQPLFNEGLHSTHQQYI